MNYVVNSTELLSLPQSENLCQINDGMKKDILIENILIKMFL